jgi:putative FmdB family regulatory protein
VQWVPEPPEHCLQPFDLANYAIITGSQEDSMPLYEYRCQSCGKLLEVLQKISEPPRTECPSCGQNALVKQLTAAGFQLKGTGWYATDFRGGSSGTVAPKADSDTASDSAAASKADSPPSDTKSASDSTAAKSNLEVAKTSTAGSSTKPATSATTAR